MVVRIGVIHTGKELEIELADETDREGLQSQIEELSGQLEELGSVISKAMERVNGRVK